MIVTDIALLKQKSEPVSSVEEAKKIISLLEEELKNYPSGCGLSAIQIGMPKQVSIVRINSSDPNKNSIHVNLINPVVLEYNDEFIHRNEGCLSFPNRYTSVKRYKHFIIMNQVIEDDGLKFREEKQYYFFNPEKKDLESIAVQHEIDHLNGITIFKEEFKKISRNDYCPCGSGLKYKKCCLVKGTN